MGNRIAADPWPAEMDLALRDLWAEDDISAKDIGAQLSHRFKRYISKNAVIGRAGRLNLKKRRSYHRPPPPPRAKVQRKDNVVRVPVFAISMPINRERAWEPLRGTEPVLLTALTEHTCRWPLSESWNAPATGFCGLPAVLSSPYCEAHRKLAFSPIKVKPADKVFGHWK